MLRYVSGSTGVSIHVPTRGTTELTINDDSVVGVSIHVPTRGTTVDIVETQKTLEGFNPRSHEGNDVEYCIISLYNSTFQSTFPRGERRYILDLDPDNTCFNPRSHEGNDASPAPDPKSVSKFQSTFPRGERLRRFLFYMIKLSFQSTFPRGERQNCLQKERRINYVSIHVPTRGTTQRSRDIPTTPEVSIHVPTRGTTLKSCFFI